MYKIWLKIIIEEKILESLSLFWSYVFDFNFITNCIRCSQRGNS